MVAKLRSQKVVTSQLLKLVCIKKDHKIDSASVVLYASENVQGQLQFPVCHMSVRK